MVAAAAAAATAAAAEEERGQPEEVPPDHHMSHSPHLHPHLLEKRVLEKQVLEDELTLLEEEQHQPRHHITEEWQRPKKVTGETYPIKFRGRTDLPEQSERPEPYPHQDNSEEILVSSGEEPSSGEMFLHSMEEVLPHSWPEETRFHHHVTESSLDETTMPFDWTGTSEADLEPTVGTEHSPSLEVMQEPVVLPVTEGKNHGQDQIVHYGLPKELMPIHPGGGSKFEDLEKEKLERAKMAQTKADDDGDIENGTSHDAEGLYSSAASLCISSLIFSFSYLRILI